MDSVVELSCIIYEQEYPVDVMNIILKYFLIKEYTDDICMLVGNHINCKNGSCSEFILKILRSDDELFKNTKTHRSFLISFNRSDYINNEITLLSTKIFNIYLKEANNIIGMLYRDNAKFNGYIGMLLQHSNEAIFLAEEVLKQIKHNENTISRLKNRHLILQYDLISELIYKFKTNQQLLLLVVHDYFSIQSR
jgi:hypothetical protein